MLIAALLIKQTQPHSPAKRAAQSKGHKTMNSAQKETIDLLIDYINAEDWGSIQVILRGQFLDVFDFGTDDDNGMGD